MQKENREKSKFDVKNEKIVMIKGLGDGKWKGECAIFGGLL